MAPADLGTFGSAVGRPAVISLAATAVAFVVFWLAARFVRPRLRRRHHQDGDRGEGRNPGRIVPLSINMAPLGVPDTVSTPSVGSAASPLMPPTECLRRTSLMLRSSSAKDVVSLSTKVTFNQRVACVVIRDLTELTPSKKSVFWWQPEDFAEFLRVRVEIGRAYRQAAKKLGVDVGSAFPPVPELAHESRRGLGLGRKRQRAKNRDAYIAAVLGEQKRQRQALLTAEDAEVRTPLNSELDIDELARVARSVSEKDRQYAYELGEMYYAADQAADEDSGESPARPTTPTSMAVAEMLRTPSLDEPLFARVLDEKNEDLVDASCDEPFDFQRKVSPGQSSKGFGVSRDMLQEVGLSVTGHSISKYQRLRMLPGTRDDSETSGGETDTDERPTTSTGDGQTYGERQKYRLWRSWAKHADRKGPELVGGKDANLLGTRTEYRTWRTWAKPTDSRSTTQDATGAPPAM
mmetsp:Transcript_14270/g.39390  ORF Transcript_14270/g.39390 Transcript_14270/m.39390 type:complete len:464 (+) Transcript_14270:85-1476(+)